MNQIHMVVLAVEGIILTLAVVWYVWNMAQKVRMRATTTCLMSLFVAEPVVCGEMRP